MNELKTEYNFSMLSDSPQSFQFNLSMKQKKNSRKYFSIYWLHKSIECTAQCYAYPDMHVLQCNVSVS